MSSSSIFHFMVFFTRESDLTPSPPPFSRQVFSNFPISNSCKCAYIFPLSLFFTSRPPPTPVSPLFCLPSSLLHYLSSQDFYFYFYFVIFTQNLSSFPPLPPPMFIIVLYNRVFWILLTTTQISFVCIYICHVIFLFEIHKNFHSCRFPTLSIIVVQVSVKSLY